MMAGEKYGDAVELAGKYGLQPYALQYSESPDFVGFPLCPEVWAGNQIPDREWDQEWDDLIAEVLQIEELLFDGDMEFALELLTRLPPRCSETGNEERRDWPPGVYLHALRRLATGDSAQSVFEDLRRVEAGLLEPVPYLESLRRQVGRCLAPTVADAPTVKPKPADKQARAFPAWDRRDAWLLIGNPAEAEGMLAFDGRLFEALSPQVFRLTFLLRGKTKSSTLKEILDLGLIRTKRGGDPVQALKKLIGRANKCFRALGAMKQEGPLHYRAGTCHSTIHILHTPSTARLP